MMSDGGEICWGRRRGQNMLMEGGGRNLVRPQPQFAPLKPIAMFPIFLLNKC